MDIDALKKELADLEGGAFTSLSDSALMDQIRRLHTGFVIQTPILPVETRIFRAVKVSERPSNKARVSYPPPKFVTSNGRLNRPGEVIFYGSVGQPFSCLYECAWKIGEFFAVSAWLTTQPILLNHLGYTTAALQALKAANRTTPSFAHVSNDSEPNKIIREWQARVFTQQVPQGQEQLYRLPIAIKDLALSNVGQPHPSGGPAKFSGVLYPSVAMWALADNVAILPAEVDSKLALFEVILLTVDSTREVATPNGGKTTTVNVKWYDIARADANGSLIWGQGSQLLTPNGTSASHLPPPRVLPPV